MSSATKDSNPAIQIVNQSPTIETRNPLPNLTNDQKIENHKTKIQIVLMWVCLFVFIFGLPTMFIKKQESFFSLLELLIGGLIGWFIKLFSK